MRCGSGHTQLRRWVDGEQGVRGMALPKNLRHAMWRRVPFFLYLAVIVALTGCIAYVGWVRTWSSVFVPAWYPPFADMRLIQSAVITVVEHGLDPQVSNAGDPWGRAFNYPMLWVAIGKALNFTNESQFILICTALTLCFAGICAFLIFCFPSFGLLVSLVSTATLLGIERGNTDLVVFCLLFPAALWLPKLWSPIPLLLATVLKLYPVFALGALLIKRQFRLFAASLAVAAAIFACLWDQLATIRLNTPVSCWLSYGLASFADCIDNTKFWRLVVTLGATGIATLGLAHCFSRSNAVRPQQGTAFNLMLVGASIYVGTFMSSSNYDYRLIFLIFCIPFLQSRPFPFARAVIVAILVAMNETLITSWLKLAGLILVWLAEISIFVVFGAYLLALALAALASLYAKPKLVAAAAAPN
jgi:hypothetical protein